jgi:membrane glycosyltransferase
MMAPRRTNIEAASVTGAWFGQTSVWHVPELDKAQTSFNRLADFTPHIGEWSEHGRGKFNRCGISAD